jgi:hypothetical protein
MRNFWIQTETEHATWLADITTLIGEPARLLELVEHISALGVEHQVFVTEPSLRAEPRRAWESAHVVDCNLGRGGRVPAKLAWYDERDQLTEGFVEDLGELLRTLEPVPGSITDGSMERGLSPIEISGYEIEYVGEPPSSRLSTEYPRTIGFSLFSDIWFPFVSGAAHPWYDGKRYFDNRELASRHTPRLNRFLAETKAAVIEAGGTWATDDYARSKLSVPWLGPHGILLDGPVPELMPADALDVPWTA